MINIDEFVVKENGRFFVDLEVWKYGNGISVEDGDRIKFSYDDKKYLGTLNRMGSDENLFELKDIKETIIK
jgi:hypothetical protein